ncbi:MAG: hypothetical protein IJQ06_03335 [Paludibacteraceae bacterium]|nr:hypothetical protein [Paludibacteraceae bacterium]
MNRKRKYGWVFPLVGTALFINVLVLYLTGHTTAASGLLPMALVFVIIALFKSL